jgi:hypothetical protein
MLNEDLEKRIEELEEKIKKMEDHQHLGVDGSKEFDGSTQIGAKEINIHGAGALVKDFTATPFNIYDSQKGDNKKRRGIGMGVAITGTKDAFNEQVQLAFSAGKEVEKEYVVLTNKTDWTKTNFAQMFLVHNPQNTGGASGPSTFPPFAFLIANRSPAILATGTITTGSSTLTDSTADFQTNSLVGSVAIILPTLESRKIISNTKNEITVSGSWLATSGSYTYQVVTPIFLGGANYPFTRLFVGDDIRLGYGASGGTQVQYIKWGEGSPEGVVRANRGSLYLRRDGSTATTLYIKTANDGLATGWTAK